MKKNSRYVFGAALAISGLTSGIDGIVGEAQAAPITAAGFTFEGIASSPGALSSFSYAGESGGTITMLKTATGGSISTVTGNGSAKSLTGNNLVGATSLYTFAFSIDGLESLTFAFDTTGSATGPRDFIVSYSSDNVNYSSFGSFQVLSTGASTGFSSGTASPNVTKSFVLPTTFSDINPLVAGDLGYIRVGVNGTVAINGSALGTGGTNRIDNAFIVGQSIAVPEPTSLSILTLAAAGLVARRRDGK